VFASLWRLVSYVVLSLSTNSVQRVVQDASHASLIEEEGDSANAIEAILDVVAAVRTGGAQLT
jgi:predicted secreted protein